MYEKILDKIEFSFSRVSEFEQCPYSLYMSKIEKSEEPQGSYYAEMGSYIHSILEKIFTRELDINDAGNYFIEHYDENVFYEIKPSIMENKFNAFLDYLAEFDESILDRYEVLGVEKEVHFKVSRFNFVGYIDLLLRDKQTEKLYIVDHKSSKKFLKKDGKPLKNMEKSFDHYRKQLYLYSKAIYEEYGEYPAELWWNHFYEGTVTKIPFDESEYVKSIAWAAKIMEEIYAEEEFPAKQDWFYCHNLCDWRLVCPYLHEEDE